MSLKQEVAELCMAIYSFETDVSPLKEELFNLPILTKQLLWNHVVGQSFSKASQNQLLHFFAKHGLTTNQSDIKLLIECYSSKKDGLLVIDDLWQIFKPLTIKFIEEINASRQNRWPLAKSHQAHYKISDLLCSIMKRTIEFLKISHSMKKNIASAQAAQMIIKPVDPAQYIYINDSLQIYINEFAPMLLKKDVELIFKHIMRNQTICEKTLKQYFIPASYIQGSINPNYRYELDSPSQGLGLELVKCHFANVNFVKSSMKKQPIYLAEKVSKP